MQFMLCTTPIKSKTVLTACIFIFQQVVCSVCNHCKTGMEATMHMSNEWLMCTCRVLLYAIYIYAPVYLPSLTSVFPLVPTEVSCSHESSQVAHFKLYCFFFIITYFKCSKCACYSYKDMCNGLDTKYKHSAGLTCIDVTLIIQQVFIVSNDVLQQIPSSIQFRFM